ncbi:hypothetical protein ACFO6R_09980 [Eubacterium multiforme]|uniref:G5 domain-containing protein n=1 Tax=Eubacterium multiforme TaxID=83339 RepID=A0ABT9USW4_9FIRM|nr:hypothetical protein [Eubacterium multiforme]MDQ0149389.1 hypothetical protein [Eubacterium multiforme]
MLKSKKLIFVLALGLFIAFFKVNLVNAADFKKHSSEKLGEETLLTINVDAKDAETGEHLLYVPFIDSNVKIGDTLNYKDVIKLIENKINEKLRYPEYKVEGFSDDVYLKEGYSETDIKLLSNKDIKLPIIKGLKEKEAYSITGNVLISKYPKPEIPKDVEENIRVIYGSHYYEKTNNGVLHKLGFFDEKEFEGSNAGSILNSDELKYLAQKSLDNHYGINKYKIKSRRMTTARNMTASIYNNDEDEILSDMNTNNSFSYMIKPQIKDPKVKDYKLYIRDTFYVEKTNSKEDVENPEINSDNSYNENNTSLESESNVKPYSKPDIKPITKPQTKPTETNVSIKPAIKPVFNTPVNPYLNTYYSYTYTYNYNDSNLISLLNEFENFMTPSFNGQFKPVQNNFNNNVYSDRDFLNFLNRFENFLNY